MSLRQFFSNINSCLTPNIILKEEKKERNINLTKKFFFPSACARSNSSDSNIDTTGSIILC